MRRRLKNLGVQRIPRGPLPTTRVNPAGLTPRQVDVLALVAAGMTNAEIAERLVVSVRTVDHHVSAILGKLDVQTRRQAAAAAGTLELAASGHRPGDGCPRHLTRDHCVAPPHGKGASCSR